MVLKRENEIFSPCHAFLSANLGHSVSPWSSAASASDSNIQSARLELWSITGARALGEVDLWLKWTKLLESYIYFCFLPTRATGGSPIQNRQNQSNFLFLSIFACFFVLFRLFYEAVAIHALIGGAAHGHCTLRSVWCAAAPIQGVISRIEIWQNIYQW